MKKGVEIVPEENYRLRGEDLYQADPQAKQQFGTKSANGQSSHGSVASTSSALTEATSYQKEFPDGYSEQHGFREAS